MSNPGNEERLEKFADDSIKNPNSEYTVNPEQKAFQQPESHRSVPAKAVQTVPEVTSRPLSPDSDTNQHSVSGSNIDRLFRLKQLDRSESNSV